MPDQQPALPAGFLVSGGKMPELDEASRTIGILEAQMTEFTQSLESMNRSLEGMHLRLGRLEEALSAASAGARVGLRIVFLLGAGVLALTKAGGWIIEHINVQSIVGALK
jgi:hypothetical protein